MVLKTLALAAVASCAALLVACSADDEPGPSTLAGKIAQSAACSLEPQSFLASPPKLPLPSPEPGETYAEEPSIYIANPDGSNRELLLQGREPAWSPDGSKVAFVHNQDVATGFGGVYDISVIDVDSRAIVRVATAHWADHDFPGSLGWTPDSCFVAFEDGEGTSLTGYLVRADGSEAPVAVSQGTFTSWSPTENRVAIRTESFNIDVLNVETGERESTQAFREAVWSPDGAKLLYRSRYDSDHYILDVATGQARLIYDQHVPSMYSEIGAWSPDGKSVALLVPSESFGSEPPPPELLESHCLPSKAIVVSLNSDAERVELGNATALGALGSQAIVWSPDGQFVAFRWYGERTIVFYKAPADGSAPPEMFLQADELAWSPDESKLLFVCGPVNDNCP